MKNKKFAVASAFLLGTLIFVSAAFADMAIGSGYDNLKNTIKHTSQMMDKGLNSYTTDTMLTLKSDGKVIVQNTSYAKVDNLKQASEERSIQLTTNEKKIEYYHYFDSETSITNNSGSSKYYLTEYNGSYKNSEQFFRDPFEQNGAQEFEKVVDAVVGSLKNYVQAQEKPEGGIEYSGSLNETQIPAIANAVSAFLFKTDFNNRIGLNSQFIDIEKDVFIKSVTGKAEENKDGIIENVVANVVVQGSDKNGTVRELEMEAVFKVSDINSTIVSKPDLTGKEIVKSTAAAKFAGIDSKYAGNYKNDIIIEKDGKFIKIGERNLIIAHVEDNSIAGRYYETVLPEYEALMPVKYDFTFDYNPNGNNPQFTYKNSDGKQGSAHLNMASPGKLYFGVDNAQGNSGLNENIVFDNIFDRVFD